MSSTPAGGRVQLAAEGGRDPRPGGFGPTAVATPANAVTAARLVLAPVVVGLVAASGPSWTVFGLALAVAGSDLLDGWLARRQGPTRAGAFIDPLADKVGVLGVLAACAARGEVSWAPVAVIGARELWMSGYRFRRARQGVSIPARPSAKVKTLVQAAAGGLCLVPPLAGQRGLLDALLWLAALLTVVTGVQYALDGRRRPGPAEP
ncbi:CDP-alcohol phosphatidyltransferase family protein [Aciditerrimonas ferrireducens]|uniref:CDP-alcohol phosphatidyltransferase family protein n=1 Tax=Aciditerrimonas ferrireducens TaxID=667306 RepID=UPI0020050334|nr:CDP-alcohol phosphatidyltransferase family protein [Aciditerrimonas ferrireducens]MCK4175972.1 CDP-alcohol phosphatidyltransferase family protein [Aciditerrimonas ferrireducens]